MVLFIATVKISHLASFMDRSMRCYFNTERCLSFPPLHSSGLHLFFFRGMNGMDNGTLAVLYGPVGGALVFLLRHFVSAVLLFDILQYGSQAAFSAATCT